MLVGVMLKKMIDNADITFRNYIPVVHTIGPHTKILFYSADASLIDPKRNGI